MDIGLQWSLNRATSDLRWWVLLLFYVIWQIVFFLLMSRLVGLILIPHRGLIEGPYSAVWEFGCAQMTSLYVLAMCLSIFSKKVKPFVFAQLVTSITFLFGLILTSISYLHESLDIFLPFALPELVLILLVGLIPVFVYNPFLMRTRILAFVPVIMIFGSQWIRMPMELLSSQLWISLGIALVCFVFGTAQSKTTG